MAREIWVQSQVASCQRLKKWYLMPPSLTLSIIRYGSRVKLSNPGKGVAPSPTPWCSSYRKGSLRVTLDYGRQLYFTIHIHKKKIISKKIITSKFQTILPHTHTHTQRNLKTRVRTHRDACTHNAKKISNIKDQLGVKQSKVNTL